MTDRDERRSFVCRCEDVTLGEIRKVIDGGLRDIEEVKRYTGLGTGPCQGKECMGPVMRILVEAGSDPRTLRPFTARPPVEAVSFAALATLDDETLLGGSHDAEVGPRDGQDRKKESR